MGFIFYIHILIRLILIGFIIALSIIDFKTMRLPDKLTLPLIGLGLLNSSLDGQHSFLVSSLSVIITYGFFWLIARIYPQGMGMGDVKFLAALASFFSLPYMVIILFLASITGTLSSFVLYIIQRDKFLRQIPFGPYLGVGSLVVLMFGGILK